MCMYHKLLKSLKKLLRYRQRYEDWVIQQLQGLDIDIINILRFEYYRVSKILECVRPPLDVFIPKTSSKDFDFIYKDVIYTYHEYMDYSQQTTNNLQVITKQDKSAIRSVTFYY